MDATDRSLVDFSCLPLSSAETVSERTPKFDPIAKLSRAHLRLPAADDSAAHPFSATQILKQLAKLKPQQRPDNGVPDSKYLATENAKLRMALAGATCELNRTREFLMQSLAELIGERSYFDGKRGLRLQRFVRILTEEAHRHSPIKAEITSDFITLLETWIPLLDVGHVLLPDSLLLKPRALTPDEREMMQSHTVLGADLLSRIAARQPGQMAYFHMAISIARFHHERYDGAGYPDRLVGMEIPLAARIAAIADVYEALRSHRVYKSAMNHERAVGAVIADRGHFDPNLISCFERCCDQFAEVLRELPD